VRLNTTTDLRALRQLLGLGLSEAAMLLHEDLEFLKQAERARNWNIPERYRDALLRWESHVQAFIDGVDESGDSFVIVYPNDAVYEEFEPEWSRRIPTALMHLAAAARAKAELDSPERELSLVMMAPTSYEEYLRRDPAGHVFPDNRESRQLWAAAFAKSYRVIQMKGGRL
jgi:hypothetical protein